MLSRDEILKQKPKEGYKFIYRYYDDYGSYIGQTKKSLKERAGKDGKSYLNNVNKWSDAIREKGIEHFNVEILEECLESEADKLEKEYIKKYNSRIDGYNSTWGGKSYNPNAEQNLNKCTQEQIQQYIAGVADICFNHYYSEVHDMFDFEAFERITREAYSKYGYNIIINGKKSNFYVKSFPDMLASKYFRLPVSDFYSWQILYCKEKSNSSRCHLAIFNTATQELITPYENEEQDALELLYNYPGYVFIETEGIIKQQLPDLDMFYKYLNEDIVDCEEVLKFLQ